MYGGPYPYTHGAVWILFGDHNGLRIRGAQLASAHRLGLDRIPETLELTPGRFDRGRRSDLAIGTPWGRGALRVLYGSADSITGRGAGYFSEATPGLLANHPEDSVEFAFGEVVVSGDFNGDGYGDIATSDPGEQANRGAVHILYGSSGGINLDGNQHLNQSTPALVGDGPNAEDYLGRSLGGGDFNADGYFDLAVGEVQHADPCERGGAVHVLYGSATGVDESVGQFLTQDTPGIAGDGSQPCDEFGSALSIGR